MPLNKTELMDALAQGIIDASGVPATSLKLEPLTGGWTNQNFKLTAHFDHTSCPKRYFVKHLMPYSSICLPNKDAALSNLKTLSHKPFCSTFLWENQELNLQLFDYLDDYQPLFPRDLKDHTIISQTARTLKRLHSVSLFPNTLSIAKRSRLVRMYLDNKGSLLNPQYLLIENLIADIDANLQRKEMPLAPCHNDATTTNFLLHPNNTMVLVDFEHTANNNPFWDLAYIAIEARMDNTQETKLLEAYLNDATMSIITAQHLLTLFKLMVMHWISLWTKLQAVDGNPSQPTEVFEDKSLYSLRNATALMESSTFQEAMRAILDA